MPSSQKLALNCNSRWRYKGSKFDSIPYKPFKICAGSFSLEPTQNQRDLYDAVSNFYPLPFGWELQLKVIFGKDPFFRDALFENGAKSHKYTNSFFVTSHLRTLWQMELISSTNSRNLADYMVQVHMLTCVLRNSIPLV